MDITQIEKLRRMNLGGIADDIESIISRNARLTADNRRHMQRVEALERECGGLLRRVTEPVQDAATAVPDDKHLLFLAEKLMPATYLASENKAILWFAKACIDAAQPIRQPLICDQAPAATVPPEWIAAVSEFCARVEANEIRSKYTYAKLKALLGGVV